MSPDDCQSGTDADLFFWKAAITEWNETGSTHVVEEGLRNGRPIPPFARTFMADLLGKKITRQPRREVINRTRRDNFIRGNYAELLRAFQKAKKAGRLKYGQIPCEMAKLELCKIYGLKYDRIASLIKTRANKG